MLRPLLFSSLLVLLFIAHVPLIHSGVPMSRYEAVMKRETVNLGLYNNTDKVRILTDANFKESVIDQKHASLVEFYNSYCGHCKRFAPVYKELAETIWPWRDVVTVNAIDCAAEENNDICREYEVMAYPTMRYFGPQYHPSEDNYGEPVLTQDPEKIMDFLATSVMNETAVDASWPNFSNLTADEANDLFKGLPKSVKFVVLLWNAPDAESPEAQTILNFVRYPELHIRRVGDDKLADKFHLNSTHRIAAVDHNRNVELIPYTNSTPKDYMEALHKFLALNKVTPKPELAAKPASGVQNSLMAEEKKEEAQRVAEILAEVRRNKHMVYQADLEQSIRYMLNNEIPRIGEISGERLLALNYLMNVLQRFNPLGPHGRVYIDKLRDYVAEKNHSISGRDFEAKVHQLEADLEPVYSSSRYIGCAGSKANYRGFTCSLWKLFHFLTVQATNSDVSTDPLEVMRAMHGFVKNFFGCTDCAEHFSEMSTRRKLWSIASKDEAVLWLWEAHNEVNNRLAGDSTEDPQFPKVQFPQRDSCQLCQKNTTSNIKSDKITWDRAAVLSFLKNINNPGYVSRYGIDDPDVLQPSVEKLRQKRMIGNVFSDMDMRMGMLLYGFCIVMMIVAFKLFAFKGYRKKPYAHDFLGKV